MYASKRDHARVRQLATQLYRERHGYLLAIARRNGACEADAQEALQEAFVSFIRHFNPDRGAPPLAWLTLTLKRECWRRYERERYDQRVGQERAGEEEEVGFLMEQIASPACIENQVLDLENADRRLGQLKPDDRLSLELQAAGFSYAEIAEHKGWTYTKVNRCMREGRAALRGD
jgi:RNA polymerase sigma factor (sigma-70 family)